MTTAPHEWDLLADAVWRHVEAYHAIVYFSPEHRAACDDIGLRGGWMAYFASRAAPLGPVPAEVVTALFYNFHPAMVRRALPDAWGYTDPQAVLRARYEGVDRTLQRLLGPDHDAASTARAATIVIDIAMAASLAGRPMFAANLGLPVPDQPALALWHATTLLREHRGDGHVAALVANDIGPCQAHVLQVAAGVVSRGGIQPHRGWNDDDWEQAEADLASRGWLDGDGRLTDRGRRARREVEQTTNHLAAAPLRIAGADRVREFLDALAPLVDRIHAASAVPYPNPMGVPRP